MTRNANTNETTRANLASGLFARLAGAAGIVALVALFSSCLLEPDRGRSSAGDGSPGYVSMNLSLERNQRVLGKAAVAGDTTFSLDSLIIVLTANGSDTVVDRFAITGRADTGAIVLASRNYTLAGLRTWKAKFYSIDTTVSPATRDTVHIDSVTFVVRPSQTTSVTKTISAAYAILRARFVSQLRDSLGAGIRYVRIRVHGVTQDSIALTGDKFNAVWFSSVDSGWAVMDTGRVMRSIDSGKTWYPQASGTTAHLRSVSFAGGIGWIAGDGGVVRKTTNSGVNWSSVSIGYTRNLRRIYFINA
ncbi:MAG TPA: YCF48-related protein, partial [Fibrobacteria bacterium]|nr:YCF48-related protein [Fibrobacteria bacterium]